MPDISDDNLASTLDKDNFISIRSWLPKMVHYRLLNGILFNISEKEVI
jgi:hypothetical protein